MCKARVKPINQKILWYGVELWLCLIILTGFSIQCTAQDIFPKKGNLEDILRSDPLQSGFPDFPLKYGSYNNLGQVYDESKTISWPGLVVTSTALAGLYTGLFNYEQKRRWDEPKVPFHFVYNLGTRGADKAGHFFATKAQASTISNLYTLSNVPQGTSDLIGVGIALSVQTLVELKDGRIDGRGFDVYDEVANVLGASWFYARQRSDFLQRFQIRWLYYPSDNRDLLAPGHRFTEDYTGHSYWLSAKVWDIMPFYWPKFIVPAGGITLNDWIPNSEQQGYYSFHLSLNPDFDYIFPQRTKFGRTLSDFFNNFYIPAPAVQVYPDLGFKLIFHGQK